MNTKETPMNLATIITDLRSALPGPKSNTLSPEKLRAMANYLEAMIPAAPSKREMDVLARVDQLWHDDVEVCNAVMQIFLSGSIEDPIRREQAVLSRALAKLLREDHALAFHQGIHCEVERIFTEKARDEFADEDVL